MLGAAPRNRMAILTLVLLCMAGHAWGAVTNVNVARRYIELNQLGTKWVRGHLLSPDLAVDGIWSVHHQLCATTAIPDSADTAPYWKVLLEEPFEILEIHLMFRYDRLDKHRAYTVTVDDSECYSRKNASADPERIERIKCNKKMSGATIQITIPSQSASKSKTPPELSICEVAIYARGCSPGTYGPNCREKCGHCKGGLYDCNMTSGVCMGGCDRGYVGPQCTGANVAPLQAAYQLGTNTETEGLEVDDNINTERPLDCLALRRLGTGNKELGWKLQLLQNRTVSEIIIYSPKNVKDRRGLNSIKITVGPYLCAERANQPTNEILSLGCRNPEQATGQDIVITSTDPKANEMVLCEVQVIVCPQGMWGDLCVKSCPDCEKGQECNPAKGLCQPCVGGKCPTYDLLPPNLEGTSSDTTPAVVENCNNGKWGEDCTLPCNCKNAKETCYKLDGSCKSGCLTGYEGINCLKVCESHHFGDDCQKECHCGNYRERCDPATGTCHTGCDARYKGKDCQEGGEPSLPDIPNLFNCKKGTFGPTCNQTCNCRDRTEPCDKYNGHCITGCAAGFTGPGCKQECPDKTFGFACQKTCRCLDKNEVCNKQTGACPKSGCDRGFRGADCYTPCKAYTYGPGCKINCRCKDKQEICDPQMGNCQSGCQPGYDPKDASCNTTCSTGKYGENCLQECGNCKDDTCNPVDGQCPGKCEKGYTGTLCNTPCDAGKYGDDCAGTCNCKDPDEVCDPITGKCKVSGCPAGKMGIDCHTDCIKGSFGENCQRKCGKCLGGAYNCNIKNGTCKDGCVPGSTLHNCTKPCEKGKFGPNCSQHCAECFSHCKPDKTCDRLLCKPGFTGPKCDKVCASNKYGTNCENECGKCTLGPNGVCNASTGVCEGKPPCQQNWIGSRCSQKCSNETGTCEVPCGKCLGGDVNCDKKRGECKDHKCERGWHGVACDDRCPAGRYGPSCDQLCGNCKDGELACDSKTGICPGGCDPAFEEPVCKKIIHESCRGKPKCIPCGHCMLGKDDCDYQTGKCRGTCKPGWDEKNCSVPCPRMTYGLNCNHICNCTGNCPCHHVTGVCEQECVLVVGGSNLDFLAPHQVLQSTLNLLPIILPTLLCAATIATLIFEFRRRKTQDEKKMYFVAQPGKEPEQPKSVLLQASSH